MIKVSGAGFRVSGFGFAFGELTVRISGYMALPNSKLETSNSKLKTSNSKLKTSNSKLKNLLSVVLLVTVMSCRNYTVQQPVQDTAPAERLQKEALMQANRQLVEEDAVDIAAYAARRGWQMQTTRSGLWYMIYEHGQGEKASAGKTATLNYTVSLPDSTVCYSSEQSGPKTFRVGQGGVESGLEEGVLLMRTGDKARLIMPPHLAHGLAGDGNCIPRRAIIIYDVNLLSLK